MTAVCYILTEDFCSSGSASPSVPIMRMAWKMGGRVRRGMIEPTLPVWNTDLNH